MALAVLLPMVIWPAAVPQALTKFVLPVPKSRKADVLAPGLMARMLVLPRALAFCRLRTPWLSLTVPVFVELFPERTMIPAPVFVQPLAVPALIEPLKVASAALPVTWPILNVSAVAPSPLTRFVEIVEPVGPVAVLSPPL